ncbi:hypothetical protein CR492_05085 [Methylocella silvestris]|uniref:DUF308 domain-containing protein n=1 Tax=Methylocella silvestris TaxID=199596 RepID=A0A2J7TK62_METSI|nr:hypothetical protein CR492_05085 [Methylocella silvestris]
MQTTHSGSAPQWLRSYYFVRAAFSVGWVAAAFTVAKSSPPIAAALLVAYPAWDAIANVGDAQRSGGMKANPSQALNAAVSTVTTIAVIIALGQSLYSVLAVFGAWAILAGLLQSATAVRRWRAGAQWAMILSGAQSALAGAFFVKLATGDAAPSITDIAPYAAFGAFYFFVSAVWLTVAQTRRTAMKPTP